MIVEVGNIENKEEVGVINKLHVDVSLVLVLLQLDAGDDDAVFA